MDRNFSVEALDWTRPSPSIMSTLILSQLDVRELLPMAECMRAMETALSMLARGDALNPLRWPMRIPERGGLLGLMPGATSDPDTLGLKVVAVFPGNHGGEYDSHQGVVLLFDTSNGLPLCILDASEVTAIRTAAVSGVATRLLANEDAGDLAILGSGVQARTHLAAMREARPVGRVRVFSPTRAHLEAFVERATRDHGIEVEAMDSARAAVEGADLICTTTSAREPVLLGEWIAPGAHINAAGACLPAARELDTEAVLKSRLFVDSRESALNEAGDFLIPRREGALDDGHIVAEIGQLLLEERPGRTGPEEITLFESLGLAVEDLIAAHFAFARARERGVGLSVDLGGRRT